MRKAILVKDWQSVQELNKLFDAGYTFETVDDNGSYILKYDELETEPIKGKVIDNELSTDITLDTIKQPHVRIEFDDIRDVPKVWVDGELIGGADKPLVNLNVNWQTDTDTENHKGFDINYFDITDNRGQSKGFHQGSVV